MDSNLVRRFGAVTAADVIALDAAAVELGVSTVQLMEVAGIQVARLAWRMIGRRRRRIHVVAGRGHNGGDGLVAARHLRAWGCPVSATVYADPAALDDLMQQQCQAARGAGVDLAVERVGTVAAADGDAMLVIDALLGTGFRGPLRPDLHAVITAIGGSVLSVDVPSGMNAGDGSVGGAAVHATATCALAAVKRGFWDPRALPYIGALYVADIGMPLPAWRRCGLSPPTGTRGGAIRRVPAAH